MVDFTDSRLFTTTSTGNEGVRAISAFALAGTTVGAAIKPNDVPLLQSYSLAYFFLGS